MRIARTVNAHSAVGARFAAGILPVLWVLCVVWAWGAALALPANAQDAVTPNPAGMSAEERRAQKQRRLNERVREEKAKLAAQARAKHAPDVKPESDPDRQDLRSWWGRGGTKSGTEEFTLFPGESVTYRGVAISWKAPADAAPVTTETARFPGYLDVVGPKSRMERVEATKGYVYIDGVFLFIAPTGSPKESNLRLFVSAGQQPSRFPLDAAPLQADRLFVSGVTPLQINEWRFSVSDKAVRYSAGAEYFQIVGENVSTSEKIEMPATQDAMKRFARFQVEIDAFYPHTRTGILEIEADADLTIKGRDAYVGEVVQIQQGQTAEGFFEGLGKEYGFTVEWVENPKGNPDSVAYARKTQADGSSFINPDWTTFKRTVSSVVEHALGAVPGASGRALWPLCAEWADATHLRLWALDYEKVIERRKKEAEKEKEKAEKERREAAEEEKREAARRDFKKREAAEKERFVALFKKDCQLTTQAYPLRHISAAAAKALADEIVDTHYLMPCERCVLKEDGTVVGTTFGNTEGLFSIESGRILLMRVRSLDQLRRLTFSVGIEAAVPLMSAEEKAVADERSNSLIVTAIPATHKKIAEMLERMDGVIAETVKESAAPLRRFRIEATLLRGGKNVETTEAARGLLLTEAEELRRRRVAELHGQADRLLKRTYPRVYDTRTSTPLVDPRVYEAYDNLQRANSIMGTVGAATPESEKLCAEARRILDETSTNPEEEKGNRGPIEELRAVLNLLERAKALESSPASQVATSAPAARPTLTKDEAARRYGIRPGDMDMFGLTQVSEEGKTVIQLANDPGEMGRAAATLAGDRRCELQFQDLREPYLIVKARLVEGEGRTGLSPVSLGQSAPAAKPDLSDRSELPAPPQKVLIENTLFLKPGEPSVLGVTNLREALILVVKWNDLAAPKPAGAP